MATTNEPIERIDPKSIGIAGLSAKKLKIIGIAALLVIALLLPFIVGDFRTFQLTMVLVYAIALLGLNLLTGFNGQFSLGHGAWFAIGAYSAAILINHFGVNYFLAIPLAGVITLIIGFLFGIPALRIEGFYLALATLALALAMPQILKYDAFEEWTGGVQGILLDKPEAPFGLPLNADQWLYYLTLFFVIVLFVIAWNILRGRTGRAIMAIRDHHMAAGAMGINTSFYKSMTFGVSAGYTGLAGALSAIVIQFVAPDSFTIFLSITFVVGSVVGGLVSIPGAIFGGIFIQFIPNLADSISRAAPWAIYGLFLIGFMYVMPLGIAGFITMIWRRLIGSRSAS